MKATATHLPGVYIIEPKVYEDARGYFFESFSLRDFREATGLEVEFVQENQAKSRYGVLRGLHFQRGEHAQAKLVRVLKGKVLDVGVDFRKDSPTFGQHLAVCLSEDNFRQLYLPRGFAHGYVVLSQEAIFHYKTDNYYCPESEGSVLWNDPALGIDWELPPSDIILSDKDKNAPLFRDAELP